MSAYNCMSRCGSDTGTSFALFSSKHNLTAIQRFRLLDVITLLQVESAISVQKLKPTIDAIKRQYGEDKDKIQRETSALYEKAGVNPLAGMSPLIKARI